MKDVPVCLQGRYHGLDRLIKDLNAAAAKTPMVQDCACGCSTYQGIQLICDLWNILKDPNFDPIKMVQQKLDSNQSERESNTRLLSRSCHGGCRCFHKTVEGSSNSQKKRCCQKTNEDSLNVPRTSGMTGSLGARCSTIGVNLKDTATSSENVYSEKVDNLLQAEDQLRDALRKLEQREKKGTELLKKADCMWVCMEDAYKQKLAESAERQMALEKELKDLEVSTKKWRKNMKDLESELNKMNKIDQEIKEKTIQKNGDSKCIDLEITDLKKRMESSQSEVEASKKSYATKKEASDKKIANLDKEVQNLEKSLAEENKKKRDKEIEGTKFIKEAREDLKKISGVLLKKKLENEDMKTEKEGLLSDIEVLMQVRDTCKDRCDFKQRSLEEDIKNIDKEIAQHQKRCIKCNKCTDTSEFHRFCTDCPQCAGDRRCFIEGDHCSTGPAMDCVCVATKKKFLDNVFENMYTVLERLIYKGRGKIVADQVLECLQRTKNGKLDEKTRKSLQAFILSGVKKQLNLTIVGGAVKTRCEMEPETYKQLMNCLQKVKISTVPKEDKGTISKKEPCTRWGGGNECHCPQGPRACICTRKAPPPPNDPSSCPEDEEDSKDNVDWCPRGHNLMCDCEEAAGPTLDVDKQLSESKAEPCTGSTCKFAKNMRTAPCVLRSDDSVSGTKRKASSTSSPTKKVPNAVDKDFCDCTVPTVSSSSCAGTKVIKLKTHKTNLTKTPSGALIIAFKRDVLESILKEINLNISSKIIIKDSKSGCLSLQLTPDKKVFDVDRTMVLKNILSSCVCFKGNSNLLKLIKGATSGLSKESGYFFNQCDNFQPNTILRETASGEAVVIRTETLQLTQKKLLAFNKSAEKYYKVKILYLDETVIEFPGVLKSTSSNNFILTVDKEFEKNFRETVKNLIRDDTEFTATIRRSISDCYLVKLGCPDIAPDTDVAVLNRTLSGNIKVIVNDSNNNNLRARLKCDSPVVKNLTKYVIDLLKKLNNNNIYVTICQKSCMRYQRFNYFETSKKRKDASDNRHFGSIVPINGKLEATLMDNLKRYLTVTSKSLHLRRAISDSSILKRRSSKNSLLINITSSINIHLLPNEQNHRKNILVQCSFNNLINDYAIAKTSTNISLVASDAYFTSHDKLETSESLSDSSTGNCNAGHHIRVEEKIIPEYYLESSLKSTTESTESGKIMQYIVIKPATKLSRIYNTDKYNASSFDDLQCASDNDKIRGISLNTDYHQYSRNNSGWDSLSFLPPQLPSFLGDVKHLYS